MSFFYLKAKKRLKLLSSENKGEVCSSAEINNYKLLEDEILLGDAIRNSVYVIVKIILNESRTVQRLLQLGFCSGTRVQLLFSSYSKKTMLIKLRGYTIILKKNVLNGIVVRGAI